MADLSRTVSATGFTDWVYDPTRDQIHIVTSTGTLQSWSVAGQAFVSNLQIGGTPSSVDISPDGGSVFVGNRELLLTSGPFAFEKTYAVELTEVSLPTGAVSKFQFAQTFYEGGIGDVAVGADGKVLLTTYFQGSGWTPLREFDPTTDAFRTLNLGRVGELPASSGSSSHLIMSEDRRYAFIQETNISDGAMHIFDTTTDVRTGGISLYDFNSSGFQSGLGDINTAAGYAVDVLYGAVYVFDLAMGKVANISTYSSTGQIVGGEFNDGGHQLFLWQGQAKNIIVLDTATWLPIGSVSVTNAVGSGYVGQGFGAMDVLSNGKFLALDLGNGLELIDLGARLKLTIAGDAASQALWGSVGMDTINASGGADTVHGYAGQDYLRGDDGDDKLFGWEDFDDLNGNQGNDTLAGGLGDDWVVGGKDNDVLFGEDGADIVYGNLGNDTCDGGVGSDIVRGGQGDDVVMGLAGDDWLAGDLGLDTLTGGAGADIFHTHGLNGIDRVTDFNATEGDRVNLLAGTTYVVSQVGADTVIDMGGGNGMILVGVQLSSLPAGWIFGA